MAGAGIQTLSKRHRKRRFRGNIAYVSYIKGIQKQVASDARMGHETKLMISTMAYTVGVRIIETASKLAHGCNRKTLTKRDVVGAITLVFPGELAKHAISESMNACALFEKSLEKTAAKKKKKSAEKEKEDQMSE